MDVIKRPGILGEVGMLARLTRDLPGLLATTTTLSDAKVIIKRRLQTRPEQFLRMAESVIYGHPRSPYLRLLRHAGCEFGDLHSLVVAEGLEGALRTLASRGMYITFDEFKGRPEVIRGSERFSPTEDDFDNPNLLPHFQIQTGGTRSHGTLVKTVLQYVAELAPDTALALHAHGLDKADHAVWLTGPVLPLLLYARLGRPPLAWFYPLNPCPGRSRPAVVICRP